VKKQSEKRNAVVRATVNPGICGFPCVIEAKGEGKNAVSIEMSGSECKQIRHLFDHLKEINLWELFAPISKNPVYRWAQKGGCHPSCPIPAAILKAAEVAMEMALPREVTINFESGSDPEM